MKITREEIVLTIAASIRQLSSGFKVDWAVGVMEPMKQIEAGLLL